MRRSGVRIPLAPPQADIRSGCRFFVCLGAVLWWRVVVLLVAPLVFRALRCDALWGPAAVCAGGRRPAREIATREPAARSGRSRSPPVPSGPSGALHTGGAWSLMCGLVRRFEARPGPATAHGHHSLAPRPPTGAAGESRETVIAFAGVCSVSGETDDTIASQIHLFSAQFWRAKASWVSWRRPEAPALVLTVSSCGAVSRMGTTKFAQRRLSMAIAR